MRILNGQSSPRYTHSFDVCTNGSFRHHSYTLGSRALALLSLFLDVANSQLRSTGVNFDHDALDNGYLVYTSRIILPDRTTTLYPQPDHLLALANQAYGDMVASCIANFFSERQCPGAMTVFAFENEVHFGSSVKNFQISDETPPFPFYHAFIIGENRIRFGDFRSGPIDWIAQSMIRCQIQGTQTVLDHKQHAHNLRCGEFNAVLTYILTKDDPNSVNFGQDDTARIMTVGRTGKDLDVAPKFFSPCSTNDNQKYGCTNWIDKLKIRGPKASRAISQIDPGSRVENIRLCELSVAESQRYAVTSGTIPNAEDQNADANQENGPDSLDDDQPMETDPADDQSSESYYFGGVDDDVFMDIDSKKHR
jgi:hypothetical protein